MHDSESRTLTNLAKPNLVDSQNLEQNARESRIPFAGSSVGVDDCLGSLHGPEASGKLVQQAVVSRGMEATDIDVAVAGDAVLQALLEALHLARRSEDRRNSTGNSWVLLQEIVDVTVRDRWNGRLGGFSVKRRQAHLLGRWSRVGGAIEARNARAISLRHGAVEGRGWGRLGRRVRATAILESGDVRVDTLNSRLGGIGSAGSVGHQRHRKANIRRAITASGHAVVVVRVVLRVAHSHRLASCHRGQEKLWL